VANLKFLFESPRTTTFLLSKYTCFLLEIQMLSNPEKSKTLPKVLAAHPCSSSRGIFQFNVINL
jgi:hypothetical protein